MSYNIDHVTTLNSRGFTITGAAIAEIHLLMETKGAESKGYYLPEINFLSDDLPVPEFQEGVPVEGSDSNHCNQKWSSAGVYDVDMRWSASGSGRSLDFLAKEILPRTTGSADLLFVWEGGDSMSGLRVENGVVTKCTVKHVLEPIVAKPKPTPLIFTKDSFGN